MSPAIDPIAELEQTYSSKLTDIENHFRWRILQEQQFGGRMAAAAVTFFVLALVATSVAAWALARLGPDVNPLRFRPALHLRAIGVERTQMLIVVESPQQLEEALAERAARQVKIMRATTKRAAVVVPAEQAYMSEVTPLENEIAEIDEALEGYYKANKKSIEGESGKRRVETAMGVIGMRRTPAKLVMSKKSMTWAKVVALIQVKFKGNKAKLEELLRTKIDPEKKALAKLPKEELSELGCKMVSDDEFFVENTPAALERFNKAA